MSKCKWECSDAFKEKVDDFAESSGKSSGRGSANFEDQIRAAMQLQTGLSVMGDKRAAVWKNEIDHQLKCFMDSILDSERSIMQASTDKKQMADDFLVSFLLSFASRTATRERQRFHNELRPSCGIWLRSCGTTCSISLCRRALACIPCLAVKHRYPL